MAFTNPVYGDSDEPLGDHVRAGNQTLTLIASTPPAQTPVGDAPTLESHAIGGDDTVTAGSPGLSVAVGDADLITDHARAGDDVVTAGASGEARAYGDAATLSGHAFGGDDSVTANSDFAAFAYGDAGVMTDFAHGGDDTLTGHSFHAATVQFGDAETMSGHSHGGDDMLIAQPRASTLYGDAKLLSDGAIGGDDTLVGASAFDQAFTVMYGDGEQLLGHAQGGDDVLVGGTTSNDTMWGDAATVGPQAGTGSDRFVFAPQTGHDQIMDFQPGKDHIELDGFGFNGFADLASHFEETADGVLIGFDGNDDILLRGVTKAQLSASDFILT